MALLGTPKEDVDSTRGRFRTFRRRNEAPATPQVVSEELAPQTLCNNASFPTESPPKLQKTTSIFRLTTPDPHEALHPYTGERTRGIGTERVATPRQGKLLAPRHDSEGASTLNTTPSLPYELPDIQEGVPFLPQSWAAEANCREKTIRAAVSPAESSPDLPEYFASSEGGSD